MTKRNKLETIRLKRKLNDIQGRQCPVCDTEIERGVIFIEDKPSKLVICKKCWALVRHMERKAGPLLDRAMWLVTKGGGDGCDEYESRGNQNLTNIRKIYENVVEYVAEGRDSSVTVEEVR